MEKFQKKISTLSLKLNYSSPRHQTDIKHNCISLVSTKWTYFVSGHDEVNFDKQVHKDEMMPSKVASLKNANSLSISDYSMRLFITKSKSTMYHAYLHTKVTTITLYLNLAELQGLSGLRIKSYSDISSFERIATSVISGF